MSVRMKGNEGLAFVNSTPVSLTVVKFNLDANCPKGLISTPPYNLRDQ